jgi:signal transduction histidine kinase
VAFGVLLVFLLASGSVGFVTVTLIRSNYQQLRTTVGPTRQANHDVLQAMTNAETGLRGFRLTGDQRFLAPYRAGVAALPAELATIRGTLRHNGTVQRQLAVEQRAAEAWLGAYATPALAGAAVSETRGKALFDVFRTANSQLDATIEQLRARGVDTLNRSMWVATLSIGGLLALGVAVGIGTAMVTTRRLIRPLAVVSDAVVALARGRPHVRLTPAGPAETRTVGASVNALADELDRAQAERERAAAQIAAAQRRLETANVGLTAANDQLAAAYRELESFSYSVSHDLRAPLRTMDGFSRILLASHSGHLDEQATGYLHRISDSATRMSKLIDALLTLARYGRQHLTTSTVVPAETARQVLTDLTEDQAGRHIQISVAPDLPACTADPTLFHQVYANLISNALKYSRGRDPAIVDIGWQHHNGQVVYHVTDNGAGFDQRYADKLFGVFQRLHTAEQFEGIGIGLALVQRIVHRHGGTIWATGTVDAGASFHFTIGPPPPAATAGGRSPAAAGAGGGATDGGAGAVAGVASGTGTRQP